MSREAKTALRQLVKLELLKLDPAHLHQQSCNVLSSLKTNPVFREAKTVALFMNLPKCEVNTTDLINFCFEDGKNVYLPKCHPQDKHRMTFLKMKSMDQVTSLKAEGPYKLREPLEGEDIFQHGGLDVLVMPGVAFNKKGHRLGHGAGYYDTFLRTYKLEFAKVPYLIGVGLKTQLREFIPMEEHDWILDEVIIG